MHSRNPSDKNVFQRVCPFDTSRQRENSYKMFCYRKRIFLTKLPNADVQGYIANPKIMSDNRMYRIVVKVFNRRFPK